ncbi:MAG: Spy/CpxP family protein refolding chaperone [Phenylobacterium sp.]|jgi:protein CpxP|uniref:Spy/CpxP family protein refolding chaperone n=1 Tax=Phenylobacterium sp. TaxID=1871053 RepID=UPI001B6770B9|nr:Spy/CpxP family protein refolding chaperone [Phenylobacterium sp.]MBP7651107.1 Spy/CpxP family protein refolding chaperone [Phenylobacterium sp.]MBP7817577.1 Spy/CpxP family protein refolding chaperone [Phenylobacterium sp.]MBP9232635.1 Spy/CpxP family protein refolding chaperone [Phenylobacterium sp.]MBP9756509.1 Spy/CpxP family protein refolding chaperone [Phenylobacterium sp.]
MKFTTPLLLSGAILTLGLGGAAIAQPAPAAMQEAGPHHQRGDRPHRDPAEMAALRAQHLRAALQLTANQEPALNAFVQSMAPPADWRDKMREHRAERATLTTPQRLDRMKARMADRQVQFTRRADATMQFYAQLSPSQKKAFDALRPMGGRGKGGGHRGGGHG